MEARGATAESQSSAPVSTPVNGGRRLAWLTRVLALALLCGLLLSPKLWLSTRSYPLTPVTDALPPIPAPLDALWFYALLLLLVAITVLPKPRLAMLVFVGLAGLLSLWDQSRWQPWFYQYLFMLGALAFRPWNQARHEPQPSLNACRLIVASIYWWSGLQKLNFCFVTDVYPWLLEPLLPRLPEAVQPWVVAGAGVAPYLEAGIGLGLLFRPSRNVAVLLAVAMHVLVLLALGPFGHNWNTVVWPWNVAMMAFVLLLFWRTPTVSCPRLVWPGRFAYGWVTLLLFGVLPGLNFWNLWDSYLSANLYSGTTLDANLYVTDEVRQRLPEAVQPHIQMDITGQYRVDVFGWSIQELNVPPYPERRIYRHIARTIATFAEEPGDVILVIQERPDRQSGVRQETRED